MGSRHSPLRRGSALALSLVASIVPAAAAAHGAPEDPDCPKPAEIPPGYRLKASMRTDMVIAGAANFGISWTLSVLIGALGQAWHHPSTEQNTWIPMLTPVVGPWVTMATANKDITDLGYVPIVALGLFQAVGATLFTVGLSTREKRLVPVANTHLQFKPLLAPRTPQSGGFVGLGLSGTF